MIKKLLALLIVILILTFNFGVMMWRLQAPEPIVVERIIEIEVLPDWLQAYRDYNPYVEEMTLEEGLIVIEGMRYSHVYQVLNAEALRHDQERVKWELGIIKKYDQLRGLIERLGK